MGKLLTALVALIILIGGAYYLFYSPTASAPTSMTPTTTSNLPQAPVSIIPISHASGVLNWGGTAIYTDPTGDALLYANQPKPSVILLTDIHGDHMSTSTLTALASASTTIVAPKAVADLLPKTIADVIVLANGANQVVQGFSIETIPMYNIPETADSRHSKGRGNGYVVEKDGYRVYISGDTANTPEMRALTNIDWALVCMNLPYTMGVEEAAEAVLAFKPKNVTPYHYRGPDGLSDIEKFKSLVNAGDASINVAIMDWYANQ